MIGMRTKFLAACLLSATPLIWAQQPFVPVVIATPGTPSTVLYGVYGPGSALVRSNDLGKTWTPLYITQPGSAQPPLKGFAIDPTNANTVYLATTIAAGAIWKSSDAGTTWIQSSAGLPVTGGSVDYFKLFADTTQNYLYAKVGSQLFRSANNGLSWLAQSNLPTSSGTVIISDSQRTRMYYIDTATLTVYTTFTEGSGWAPVQQVIPGTFSQTPTVTGIGVPFYDPNDVYVTINFPSVGITAYGSIDGSAYTDQSVVGLGPFTQILTANTGPSYALTDPVNGFYRSIDSGQSWQALGNSGLEHFGMTAVDPVSRTTAFGVETVLPSGTPTSLIQSSDSGNTWAAISSVITPSIGKPVPMLSVTLEQGAPYSVAFSVQTAESPVWQTPVTISTSGESWLQLATPSGTTPVPETLTISTAVLLPGVYTSTITIAAPQTFNKTVTVPVQLTVKPLGGLGPGYMVSTAAGNGSPAGGVTSGAPTNLAVGGAKAVAIDPSGNVFFSAGNRIWQLSGGTLKAVAGNGANGSDGNGGDPLAASISDPDAIAFDVNGTPYFTEFAPERVRELTGGSLVLVLDMTRFNQPLGSHSLVVNPFMFLTLPTGILHFDGSKLQTAFTTTFSNPYSMIADAAGNLYVSDMGLNQIFKVTPAGVVTVFAGTGVPGFGGDGSAATQAMLNAPAGIAFDAQGTLYIADSGNNRIRTITADGNMHTIAGSGLPGFAGDGATADFASFMNPLGVAVDPSGNVYVADSGNNRLRLLSPQITPTPGISAIRGPNRANNLAPGAIFSLYGTSLAPQGYSFLVSSATWPRSVNGISVTINGVAAPLYYVSPTQINGQIPFETAPGTATAIITVNGSLPAQMNFPVVPAAPDVLVQGGGTQAVAVNQTGTVNSPTTAAHPGDVEVVYLSGIGIPSPSIPTAGSAPSTPPFAQVNYPYQIALNGQQVPVYFLGYAPGYTALVQANFGIPANLTGDLSLVITVNGLASVPTIVSVR